MADTLQKKEPKVPVKALKPFPGMIAFYDILGYKQIAQSGIGKNICDVLHILKTAKTIPKKEIHALYQNKVSHDDDAAKVIEKVLNSIETENISDSLVSSINFSACSKLAGVTNKGQDIDPSWAWFFAYVFTLYCSRLYASLFKSGLPVRGAIEYGDIFKHDRILAGKPLINTYALSESLNCAGVVLTVKAETWYKTLLNYELLEPHFNLLKVPTKKGVFQLTCLSNIGLFEGKTPISDVRHFVCDSFSKHDKDVPAEILDKLENTINLFKQELPLEVQKRETPSEGTPNEHEKPSAP